MLLKCGPYGGHRLNGLRQGDQWVNVAHDHPDANHFMLYWKGRMWASDDGYPHQSKAGANHNLVLVDGKGPVQRGEGWLQPIAGMGEKGKLGPVNCRPGLFQARGDASGYYPMLTAAQRWLAVVDDQYVVIADHLSAGQPHRFDWLLHTSATVTPTGPRSWRLGRQGETLHLTFALPAEASGKVTKDVLEGTERGVLLTVSPAQPASRTAFVAVFSEQPLPGLQAELGADRITVHLPGGRDVPLEL
ncbi:MAG: heparinase II/III family protein [Armatimonadetes bacterium]|nr:heparinase II/III family protein [Armatimonadota bacterium]